MTIKRLIRDLIGQMACAFGLECCVKKGYKKRSEEMNED